MHNKLGHFACGRFPRVDRVEILNKEDACIIALPSNGCTFLGIVFSYKVRALIPRPIIDLGFMLISIKPFCMCPH